MKCPYPFRLFVSALLLSPSGQAAALEAPQAQIEYNYSNGDVGQQALGLSATEVGDHVNEDGWPLEAPVLRQAQLTDAKDAVLEGSKNLPEKLQTSEK